MPESQLLSTTGLNANPQLRQYMIAFFRDTRASPESRTIKFFLDTIQEQFTASIKEREAYYLGEVLNLKRNSNETVQSFWFRFDDVRQNLEGSAVELPEGMLFVRLLRSLNLNAQMRLAIISRLDCHSLPHNVHWLRRVSTELLGVYKEMLGKPESALVMNPEELSDDDQDANEDLEETLIARAKRRLKNQGWKPMQSGMQFP